MVYSQYPADISDLRTPPPFSVGNPPSPNAGYGNGDLTI
jgi:hypothetical protein